MNTTRTVKTRSQAKHSGLKWGPKVGSNSKEENARQRKHCADDLDVSPIAIPLEPTAPVLSKSLATSNAREIRKTTVQRSKVKSPINQFKITTRRREKAPVSNTSGKEENSDILEGGDLPLKKISDGGDLQLKKTLDGGDLPLKKKSRTPRTRMEELVQQVLFLFQTSLYPILVLCR